MNWYKRHKQAVRWRDVGTGFALGVLPFTALSPSKVPVSKPQEPSPIVQPAGSQLTSQPTSQPARPVTPSITQPISAAPRQSISQTPTSSVDVSRIIHMESSGRPKAVSRTGAAGLMQVMPTTWEDIAKKIGKYQGFEKWKFDESANVAIGSYYINTEIPRMLASFKIPDTIETRLASYNWGIGNVNKAYKAYGEQWKNHLPQETANYLKKYKQ